MDDVIPLLFGTPGNRPIEMERISLRHRLEYAGYLVVEKAICAIPDRYMSAVARLFAFFAYRVIKIRRRVALDNLKIAFPESIDSWRNDIAYRSYFHFSMLILEFMKLMVWTPTRINKMVTQPERGQFHSANDKVENSIFLSAHFGNWEIGIGYLHTLGWRTAVIQQRQQNRLVDRRMKLLREKWGMEIVYPRGAVENCLAALKNGKNVGLLGDQDAGKRGIFTPFFGLPSSTHIGAAIMHLRSGLPILFTVCTRLSHHSFRLEFTRIPDPPSRELTEENIRFILKAYNRLLEKTIRQHPDQYFWMHRRWKSTPAV